MNKIWITGRLTEDIDLRTSRTGKSVIQNRLAIRRNYKNNAGEYDSDYLTVMFYGSTADLIYKYCKKGSKLGIEGRVQTSTAEYDGVKRYYTKVIVEQVEFLENKKQDSDSQDTVKENESVTVDEDPFNSFGEQVTLNDDDLPF